MSEAEKTVFDPNEQDSGEYRLPMTETYPDLTPEQQAEAEFYLLQYFEIIHSIFEEKYGLTSSDLNATFKREK